MAGNPQSARKAGHGQGDKADVTGLQGRVHKLLKDLRCIKLQRPDLVLMQHDIDSDEKKIRQLSTLAANNLHACNALKRPALHCWEDWVANNLAACKRMEGEIADVFHRLEELDNSRPQVQQPTRLV